MTIRFKLIMAVVAAILLANALLALVSVVYLQPVWAEDPVARVLLMTMVATAASLVLFFLAMIVVMRPIGRIVAMSQKVIAGRSRRRGSESGRRAKWASCARPSTAWPRPSPSGENRFEQAVRQQVTRAEKLASIGRLAAGVAHEINNPLTGVLTFAHLMREKPNMDAQDREDLDLIIHETTRAADIVRGLLDFARERPIRMEPLDLNDVVRRTVRLIANQKKFEHIVIDELLHDDLPVVRGDMNQLQQVLLNLSLNACTAMPKGGTLTIRTIPADGKVIVKVIDTGCGIKAEHLDRIFRAVLHHPRRRQRDRLGTQRHLRHYRAARRRSRSSEQGRARKHVRDSSARAAAIRDIEEHRDEQRWQRSSGNGSRRAGAANSGHRRRIGDRLELPADARRRRARGAVSSRTRKPACRRPSPAISTSCCST